MQRKVHLEKMKPSKEHWMILGKDDVDGRKEFVQEDYVLMILDYQLMKIQELSDENIVQMKLWMDEDLFNITISYSVERILTSYPKYLYVYFLYTKNLDLCNQSLHKD
jgi:hypothetical protein